MSGPHPVYFDRLAKILKQGEFIPNRHGSLSFGYDLWARHANGDVIVHCGGNAGWFDWFTPVEPGDDPDFKLTIDGRQYRLVRGVDHVPSTFTTVLGSPGKGVTTAARTTIRRVGRPSKSIDPPAPPPAAPAPARFVDEALSFGAKPYRVEAFVDDAWRFIDRYATEWAASSAGRALFEKHGVPHRLLRMSVVLRAWE